LLFSCACAPRTLFLSDALFVGAVAASSSGAAPEVDTASGADEPSSLGVIRVSGPVETVDLQPPLPLSPPAQPAFDLGAAYGAIRDVDLSACRDEGLAAGYGRVVVGFMPDGRVGGVALDLPWASSAEARDCVESAYRQVRVRPFPGGQPATARASFYVG
jgi:hypothetical protein